MDIDLFPCAFCGNREPTEGPTSDGENYTMECPCGIDIFACNKETAHFIWNTRFRAEGAKWHKYDDNDPSTWPPPGERFYLVAWNSGELFVIRDKWVKWLGEDEDGNPAPEDDRWGWSNWLGWDCVYWMDLTALPLGWDEQMLTGYISRYEEVAKWYKENDK